ncbi:hypothetical protein NMG60_11031301 [Bertholletia excelsa]
MERESSSHSPRDNTDEQGLLSCWGRLKLKLPWSRGRRRRGPTRQARVGWRKITSIFKPSRPRPRPVGGSFGYDPLSYAQNFDDGWDEDDEDSSLRGFSVRYAAPPLKSHSTVSEA